MIQAYLNASAVEALTAIQAARQAATVTTREGERRRLIEESRSAAVDFVNATLALNPNLADTPSPHRVAFACPHCDRPFDDSNKGAES